MQMRLVLAALGGLALIAGPGLYAPALAATAPATDAQRLVPLEGGRNFRDLGGYRAADGRTVKWRLLYRSGSMHGLTPADFATLRDRGIRVVCDLRDTRERTSEPVVWPAGTAPAVLSDDYLLDMKNFLPAGSPAGWTAETVAARMAASYPAMLDRLNGQYRRMFAELLAGHAPLAFNCSAGKDRTGLAAALVLTALGVPRETVIADYQLTDRYLDTATLVDRSKAPSPTNPLAQLPPQLVQPLLAADRRYIEAALAVLDSHPGGPEAYLHDALGLSHDDLVKLRALYLE